MKNAFFLLTNEYNESVNKKQQSLLDCFGNCGYFFEDVRILCIFLEERLHTVLQDAKSTYDNLILFVEKSYYQGMFDFLEKECKGYQSQRLEQVSLFINKEKSIFLLEIEDGKRAIEGACIPHLQKKYGIKYAQMLFRCVGASESRIQSLIAKAKTIDENKMHYIYTRAYGEDVVKIFFDENTSKRLVDDVMRLFADGLNDSIYSLEDIPLREQLIHLLKVRNKRISVAESFTGGGIAKQLTSVSGASSVYFEGVNTYQSLSKIKRLGVSEYTLRSYGAVSDNTAYEMAAGLIATGDCDIAIATTGLAGPKSDDSLKPVGLCYIAVGTKEKVFVYRYKFDGTREEITNTAINYALFLAYKQLKNM